MKKTVLLTAVLASLTFATAAQADGVSFEFVHAPTSKTSTVAKDSFSIYPSVDALGLTFDARLQGSRAEESGALSEAVELRVKKVVPLGYGASAWLRVGAGQNYSNGSKYSFYSYEPAIAYQWNDKWSSYVSVKHSTPINDAIDNKTTNLYTLQTGYNVTKVDNVYAKVMKTYTDTQGWSYGVGYARKF